MSDSPDKFKVIRFRKAEKSFCNDSFVTRKHKTIALAWVIVILFFLMFSKTAGNDSTEYSTVLSTQTCVVIEHSNEDCLFWSLVGDISNCAARLIIIYYM